MTSTALEKLPATWDDARDGAFFRITARLFSPAFCLGASVLLASNDDSTVQITRAPASTTTPAGDDCGHARPERALIPVRIRRTD